MCRYCSLIRSKLYGRRRCLEQDRIKLKEASEKRTLLSYTCHGGLVEAIIPVYSDNALVGFVMTGQFRTASSPPTAVLEDWACRHGCADEIVSAFAEVPQIPVEKLPSMFGIFSILVRSIAREGIAGIHGDMLVEKVLHRIRCDIANPPSLAEAARLAGRSRSSVSHAFKARLGRSFKSCVIDMRLSRAEEILGGGHSITVKEVSSRLGFKDEFYFSRIFRKYRGFPPSHLIRHRRAPSTAGLQDP